MEIAPGVVFEPLPREDKYRKAVPGLMRRIRDLYQALVERFGDEGLELIRDVSAAYGDRVAASARGRVGSGVKNVGLYVLRIFDIVGGDWKVTELSDERMVIAVSECPYPFEQEAVCKAHTTMEKAVVRGLDPDLEYYVGRCRPAGDEVCEHVICRRRS